MCDYNVQMDISNVIIKIITIIKKTTDNKYFNSVYLFAILLSFIIIFM